MLRYTEQRSISRATVANPDIVRLHEEWLERRPPGAQLPSGPVDLDSLWCVNDVMVLEQVAARDFYYRHYGANIERASGFTMLGKRTSDFDSSVGKFFIEKYVQSLAGCCPLYTVHRAIHAKGVSTWERLILPLADDKGAPHYLLVYNRPLAFASELLVGVLDSSPDTILALAAIRDDKGKVSDFSAELVNEKGESEFGVSAAGILFRPVTESLPELFNTALLERCVEVVESGNRFTFVHEQALRGTIKSYRVSLSALSSGLVATFTDITELSEANARLEALATTDALTGLANRRHFLDVAERECQRSHRFEHPLSVLALDIDHFKQVNDTYGHAGGDEALRKIADDLRAGVRQLDVIGRLGGEEFCVLLPETSQRNALVLAERLRERVAASVAQTPSGTVKLTVSIGVAGREREELDIQSALVRADDLLYEAKRAGRNRVCSEPVGSEKP